VSESPLAGGGRVRQSSGYRPAARWSCRTPDRRL